jgi:hypothetical protein
MKMASETRKPGLRIDHLVLWGLAAATFLTVIAVALLNPGVLSFRTFNAVEFVQSMLPLVMFALFIERALEVFLTSWRAHETAVLKERASQAKSKRSEQKPSESDLETLRRHKGQTQRIAFFAGTTLGVVIAALGVRVLELSVDPAAFELLPRVQQRLFRITDVLMTGAVLGGGSDALHQLVLVFTNFFQSAAGKVKGVGD